jgi:hemerythrin-like domain-containing protein
MALPTQRLRDEHASFLPHVESLKTTAVDMARAPVAELRPALEDAYLFLENHLMPHARAEDQVLYPEVARLLGSEKSTASMTRDHVEIGTLANELGILRVELVDDEEPARELLDEIRRVLYGLHALIKAHFAKEEELYLPLIDGNLTEDQAEVLFDAMGAIGKHQRFSVV